jgi:hypothetical protein
VTLRSTRPTTQQVTLGGQSVIRRTTGVGLKRTPITPEMVKDPHTLAMVIQKLHDMVEDATAASRSRAGGGSVIIRGIALTGGTALQVPHSLGRPYTGMRVVLLQASSGAANVVVVANQDPNTNSQFITILSNANCTVDIEVEG